jgi:ribonuclease G
MSKEMIISVNGREKKIAILENGQVTEFYIERGEENSGVVGNIYKGKVQRVLPGMQSAFVEIGLERDAFLYVSDFFDEEEELERIMMEKSKKVPVEEAEREAVEQVQKKRFEREFQMEELQEIAEPLVALEITETPDFEISNIEETVVEEQPRSKKGRGRKGKKSQPEAVKEEPIAEEPIFVMEDSGFERIIDDEDTGEMFKDAFMQEAIIDKVRAIEFDMESTSVAEVGSLIDAVETESKFERIADEDEVVETVQSPKGRPNQRNKSRGKQQNRPQNKQTQPRQEKVEEVKVEEVVETPNKNRPKSKPQNKKSAKPNQAEVVEAKIEEVKAETPKAKQNKSNAKGKPTAKGKKPAKSENAEASLKEKSATSEMAVRRGNRGRSRGRNSRPPQRHHTEERYETSEMSEVVILEDEFAQAEMTDHKPSPRSGNGRRESRRERTQPAITDLLREGQEILVQIAKEPIARKGARITSHISLPGRYLVYMPTVDHTGVSRKIENHNERNRLRNLIQKIRNEEDVPSGGFIVRTAGIGVPEQNLRDDARYLVRTWLDIKKDAEKSKSPALVHQDLDVVQRILRDQLSDDFAAIRVDSEEEYMRTVEFVNLIQPKMVNRVKLFTRDVSILEAYGVQDEIDKALRPRVWLKSGGYLVINQTEALVAIDVNTGKFVGKGNARLEDTITKTNMEAVEEVARQIRLRDLGGIIVLDLIDMEDRRNRHKVLQQLNEYLSDDKSPTKVLPFNDFGLVIMTRKRVKQSLERTLCTPCEICQGSGWVKSPQTVCFNILDEARRLSRGVDDVKHTTLRVHTEVAKALRGSEREVLQEIEDYLGFVDITSDSTVHQEQFDFAFM